MRKTEEGKWPSGYGTGPVIKRVVGLNLGCDSYGNLLPTSGLALHHRVLESVSSSSDVTWPPDMVVEAYSSNRCDRLEEPFTVPSRLGSTRPTSVQS